ncbi:hypothetical protein CFAEC_06105 [Corynebacterium faecale]|uniref:hypothetical protein n=1 Tax=Corynebacterium faecale TaxID=1758466 RepID=UPI0025B2DD74|nr:hypothetical protein [Corynebacterium faecale]WJY92057.1 hypothetical protein CFAEC_06105 [Corynebacterium faecale]
MADPSTLAAALDYMERKALRCTSRGKRSPYSHLWRLRELELTDSDGITDLGWSVLTKLEKNT